ncbi:MAG: hypothetical protein ACI3ZQ_10630 [Candidatus Cryptobacteroides sp.]
MKHKLILILLTIVATISTTSCSIVAAALQIKNETTYECASVMMEDGRVLEGSIILPNGTTKEISFKDAEGKKQKIASADIGCVEVWRKGHEDNRFLLFYKEFLYYTDKKKGEVFRQAWMLPKAAGEHLVVMSNAADIRFDKNGDIFITGERIFYYAFRESETYGTNVATAGYSNSSKLARNAWQEYLSDDPELCAQIADKSIDPFDFDTICDEYRPR